MVVIDKHAKGQCHWSLGSKVRIETDGLTDRRTDERTEAIAITSRANAVCKKRKI